MGFCRYIFIRTSPWEPVNFPLLVLLSGIIFDSEKPLRGRGMRLFGRKKEKEEKKENEKQIPPHIDVEEIVYEFFGLDKSKKPIEEIAPGHYRVRHVTSGTSASEGNKGRVKEVRSEEGKKETAKPENLSRDEILLEILKELKELNSNLKAVIVRMDVDREEQRKFREEVINLLGAQVAKPF